jgi:TRAP-type transport system small permease protein
MTAAAASLARHLDRAFHWLDQAVRAALVVLMASIFLLLTGQVLLRYVVFYPLAWIEELATFLAAYLALWGASSCLRAGSHVVVDTFYRMLPEWPRRLLTVLIYLLLLYFCYALYTGGQRLAWLGATEISDSGYFYQYWPRMALVTGAVLIALQAANLLFQEVVSWLTGKPYYGGVRRRELDLD